MTWEIPISEVDFARAERQAAWREKSAGPLKARRKKRLDDLQGTRTALRRAIDAYQVIDEGQVPTVRLRESFVRLAEARPSPSEVEPDLDRKQQIANRLRRDVATRPPLTKLVFRKTNALALYLTAIYVAHLEGAPGAQFQNRHRNAITESGIHSWASLAGLGGPAGGSKGAPRARRVRVTRALTELAKFNLVEIGSAGEWEKFEGFRLNREDGSQHTYSVPGEDAGGTLKLPASFFLKGWHLVLSPAEIAVLLAIISMNKNVRRIPGVGQIGVGLPDSVRWGRYGLSGEAYESAHELEEFGLIQIHDPMPERRRGKFQPPSRDRPDEPDDEEQSSPQPYRFVYDETTARFDRDPYEVVTKALKDSELPPRLDW